MEDNAMEKPFMNQGRSLGKKNSRSSNPLKPLQFESNSTAVAQNCDIPPPLSTPIGGGMGRKWFNWKGLPSHSFASKGS